jgi:2-polyprenyl-6-methoxyphenol hydroxylase-like FAD-dependent oxidoreductase
VVAPGLDVRRDAEIIVVGAGPTGLALALQAHACGGQVRIVDQRRDSWRPSRALLVHARTLEALRPLAVTDALLARADVQPRIMLHAGSRTTPMTPAAAGLADSPFGHLTMLRQADLEEVLATELADRGVTVERETAVTDIDTSQPHGVRVQLHSPAGTTTADCLYLAGCDGAASTVRRSLGISFPGRTYPNEIVLADLELDTESLAPDAIHAVVHRSGLLFLFPVGERATWRMLATRPAASGAQVPGETVPGQLGPPISASELTDLLTAVTPGPAIRRVAWSSRVRLDRRLADAFGSGRVFLAGDAAHVHSPAGGQGMNTGIQDALNLGWKLAYAANERVDPRLLLATYELERRPVARRVATWTDAIFWAESSRNPIASLARALVPLAAPLAPVLARSRPLLAEVVRFLGQLRVAHHASPLSIQHAARRPGVPRAGDRLPDRTVIVDDRPVRLHAVTARPGVHVLLHRSGRPLVSPDARVAVHRLDQWNGPALMIVRPDGYVGLSSDRADAHELTAWLRRAGIMGGGGGAASSQPVT